MLDDLVEEERDLKLRMRTWDMLLMMTRTMNDTEATSTAVDARMMTIDKAELQKTTSSVSLRVDQPGLSWMRLRRRAVQRKGTRTMDQTKTESNRWTTRLMMARGGKRVAMVVVVGGTCMRLVDLEAMLGASHQRRRIWNRRASKSLHRDQGTRRPTVSPGTLLAMA